MRSLGGGRETGALVIEHPPPNVGDRIRQDFGPANLNTWKHAAEVRAIVDGWIVIRRWYPHKRYHGLELIDPIKWSMWISAGHYIVKRSRARVTP